MKELTQQQKKNRLDKMALSMENKDIAVLMELSDINDSLDKIANKNDSEIHVVSETKFPDIQEISIKGVSVITIKGDKGDSIIGEKGDKGDSITGPKGDKGDSITGPKGDKGDSIIGLPGKDGSPDTPEQIKDKLEKLEGETRLDKSAIKGLDEEFKRVEGKISSIPRGGTGRTGGMQMYDLSSQTTGSLKIFSVPKNKNGMIIGSDFPTVLMENNGFTINGTRTQITLTTDNAPSAKSQLVFLYTSVFNT